MTWFKVDDGFWSHPKTATLSDAAVTLWVRAGSYSCQHLTDGFVKHGALRLLGSAESAAELVDVVLWHVVDGGWVFHDWDEYQETSEAVKKRRDEARERQRRSRELREEQRRQSQGESRVTSGVTDGVTTGVSSQPPTRPDPTRPDPSSEETLGGGVALGDARDPRPTCSRHPNGNPNDESCRGCGRVRTWDEAHSGDQIAEQRRLKESRAAALAACTHCDSFGWALEDDGQPVDPATRCTIHQEAM